MKEINQNTKKIMLIKTISGSTYEIIEEEKQIRRLYGTEKPTLRQGNDGEWKDYWALSFIENFNDKILIIFWDNAGKATMTSPITNVIFDDDNSRMN